MPLQILGLNHNTAPVELREQVAYAGDDVTRALKNDAFGAPERTPILERPLTEGFDLTAVVAELQAHYFRRALAETDGNRTQAARLLGYPADGEKFRQHLKKLEQQGI